MTGRKARGLKIESDIITAGVVLNIRHQIYTEILCILQIGDSISKMETSSPSAANTISGCI